jgi:hypothetical protein
MEKAGSGLEAGNISNLFLSSKENKKDPGERLFSEKTSKDDGAPEVVLDRAEDEFEIEKTVNVRKKIAYPNKKETQNSIKGCLLKHLEEGYIIKRIELNKTNTISRQGNRERTEEDIIIYIKEPSP